MPGGLAAWPLSAPSVAVFSGIGVRDDGSPSLTEGILADGTLRKRAGRNEEPEVSAVAGHQW